MSGFPSVGELAAALTQYLDVAETAGAADAVKLRQQMTAALKLPTPDDQANELSCILCCERTRELFDALVAAACAGRLPGMVFEFIPGEGKLSNATIRGSFPTSPSGLSIGVSIVFADPKRECPEFALTRDEVLSFCRFDEAHNQSFDNTDALIVGLKGLAESVAEGELDDVDDEYDEDDWLTYCAGDVYGSYNNPVPQPAT